MKVRSLTETEEHVTTWGGGEIKLGNLGLWIAMYVYHVAIYHVAMCANFDCFINLHLWGEKSHEGHSYF